MMSMGVSGESPPRMKTSAPGIVCCLITTIVGDTPPGPGFLVVVVPGPVGPGPFVVDGPGGGVDPSQETLNVGSACHPEGSWKSQPSVRPTGQDLAPLLLM